MGIIEISHFVLLFANPAIKCGQTLHGLSSCFNSIVVGIIFFCDWKKKNPGCMFMGAGVVFVDGRDNGGEVN